LFALFAAAAARGVRRGWLEHDDNWNFVASFSLPLFCLFAAASFKTQIHVNWTAPAFLSLSLGASALALDGLESDQPSRAKRWRWGAGATVFLCGLAIVFGHTSLAWGVPKSFVYAHAGGWEETAWHVDIARGQVQKETNQEPFLLGMDKYNIAAELGYYLGTPDNCVNLFATGGQGLGYRYWTDLRKFEGRPAIAVIPVPKARDDTIAAIPKPSREIMAQLRLHFEQVGEPRRVGVATYRGLDRQVYLVICTGYHAAESKAPDPR
jgi:hypothetical protein